MTKIEYECNGGTFDVGDILEYKQLNSSEHIAKVRMTDIDVVTKLMTGNHNPTLDAGGIIGFIQIAFNPIHFAGATIERVYEGHRPDLEKCKWVIDNKE